MSGNPANLSKLGTAKDVAGSLKNQLELAANLFTTVPKVFSAVGVKIRRPRPRTRHWRHWATKPPAVRCAGLGPAGVGQYLAPSAA
jgi:hypothetical protein